MYGVRAVPVRLGRPITVISTHLVLPSLRTDIWRPEVWRKAAEIRGARMRIVEELLVQRDRYGDDLPVIVGGDFNTRAGDSLLQPLIANGMTDVFDAVGHGWPNTMTAEFPIARIDFIWVGEQVEPLNAQVATTPHSDHRMVVAEVAVRQPAAHLTYSPSSSRSSRR
jgi:endonuclease/exonuclease/phosphatase (EEP) superfamily protein YafD